MAGGIVLHLIRSHEKLRVRYELLHRSDVHLAGAEASWADRTLHFFARGEMLGAEVQLLRRRGQHVADRVRILAVVQIAIWIQEQSLAAERARDRALLPIGNRLEER